MDRVDPAGQADERTSLLEFLDAQRAIVFEKCAGLTHEQLNQRLEPSTLTLGGLLKHLALNEDSWIQERFLGLPEIEPWASAPWDDDDDWEFHSAKDDSPEYLRNLYEAARARTLAGLEGHQLDELAAVEGRRGPFTLRWVLLHLIEETARHAGHADLIRESIDGQTGE